MDMKDTLSLAGWIRGRASLEEVEREQYGLVDNQRYSDHAKRAYRLLWAWSAPRFSGSAGVRQDRFAKKCGNDALERRFARAKRIADRLGR